MRKTALLLAVVVYVYFFIALSSWADTLSFDSSKISKVDIEHISGKVVILANLKSLERATLKVTKVKAEKSCKVESNIYDHTLVIKTKSSDNDDCQINLDVIVPSLIDISVKTVSGSVKLQGTVKRLQFNSVSGDLLGEGNVGELTSKTISGDININKIDNDLMSTTVSGNIMIAKISGSAKISSVSGDVELKYARLVKDSSVSVSSVSGDVLVFVPNSVNMRNVSGASLSFEQSSEKGKNNLDISLRTISGNLKIKRK